MPAGRLPSGLRRSDMQFIRASVLTPILNYLRNEEEILQRVMLRHFNSDVKCIDSYDLIPLHTYVRFLEGIAKELKTEHFGLKMGQSSEAEEILGPVGLLFSRAPTLRVAFRQMMRYINTWQTATHTALICENEYAAMEYQIVDRTIWPRRQDAEFSISATCKIIRDMMQHQWRPVEICFEHAPPENPKIWHDILRCPVRFNQGSNRIVFWAADLDRRIRGHDPGFLKYMERHAEDLVIGQNRNSVVEQVEWYVEQHLSSEDLSIVSIARAFGLSVRSLQRRMADSGVNMRELIKGKRLTMAATLILNGDMPFSSVAQIVGYSDSTTLWRAFRAWSGVCPSAFTVADMERLQGEAEAHGSMHGDITYEENISPDTNF
ncbi:AraC family transcriptional regulator [Gluconacetobacter entanii]|nr:AraC family transcriptional regulator [Gluconacetobacter entanii]MCE2579500.1 AraC family transcriptional regulator [Komagataeibacter sp. FNDCR1]MCW4590238.1 AraC family transcriptional regulator [Gluconacetobacter entanii]MCW4594289.1 AraC family transcriptional regulator [Gluconacetobacter entanii]NPC89484.1 AraC family transcriptional regulator [Gluconacetobacter entanii]